MENGKTKINIWFEIVDEDGVVLGYHELAYTDDFIIRL